MSGGTLQAHGVCVDPLFPAADDCWMEKRDASGRIVPFANKFPSGMKALADYIHGL